MSERRTSSGAFVVGMAALLYGCTGTIDADQPAASESGSSTTAGTEPSGTAMGGTPTGGVGGASASTTSGGATSTTSAAPDPTLDISNDPSLGDPLPVETAGPLTLRRLSPREYGNTLRDLLGDTYDAGAELPDEAIRESGFAVYESASVPAVKTFLETAERLLAEGRIQVPGCGLGGDEHSCATQFINDFGRRAFRRPVKSSELENLLGLFDTARGLGFEYTDAVGHVATAMLQSSGFLYLWDSDDSVSPTDANLLALTPYQVASRLSYLFWGTMPDDQLAAAADNGQLSTAEQVGAQAARLLQDSERVTDTLSDFLLQWLHLDNLDDLQKDPTTYPSFNAEVRAAYKTEILGFGADVVLRGDGTLRSLLGAGYTVYGDGALAPIYGVVAQPDASGHLMLDPAERAGLFTLPGLLAATSDTVTSNPARRGKLMWRSVLCGELPEPPANVPPVGPPSETTTTRARFEAHSQSPCAGACHRLFDPLGFAFENYDAIGAYRTEENGLPVDASGTLVTPAGGVVDFTNAVELMTALSTAYEVDRCVAEQWLTFTLSRKLVDADQGSLEVAYRAAGAGPTADFSVRDFIVQTVQTKAFRLHAPSL